MKFSSLILLLVCQMEVAAAFEKTSNFLYMPTGQIVTVKSINSATGMASLWGSDNKLVKLSDLTQQTEVEQNDVGAFEMILVHTESTTLQVCQAYYVFENGFVHFGCLEGWKRQVWGLEPILSRWNIDSKNVVAEIKSRNGFDKKSCAILKNQVADLKAGQRVRVDVLFANGEVMVQNFGLNLIDATEPHLNRHVHRTNIENLKPCQAAVADPGVRH